MILPIPRISTRGYYDLHSGRTLKRNDYYLYPRNAFDKLDKIQEMVIVIHGLRNDRAGAVAKATLAKQRLYKLGYRYPVIGFSYDSNTTGAHLAKHARHALRVGEEIAKKNGRNLGTFILNYTECNPDTKIRLMGHSLGSLVILSTIQYLYKHGRDFIESVHLFGASIPDDSFTSKHGKAVNHIVRTKVMNYYAPTDEVLGMAKSQRYIAMPLGLDGSAKRTISKYQQRRVVPINHRFASYLETLESFP